MATFVNSTDTLQSINPAAIREMARQPKHDFNSTDSAFSKALGTASDIMSTVGPVGGALAQKYSSGIGSAVTQTAISALGNGAVPGFSNPAYSPATKNLGGLPAAPLGGGGSMGGVGGSAGGTSMDVQGQLSDMQNSQVEFLALQANVQNQALQTTMLTNILKAKSDQDMGVARNLKQ